MDQDVAIIGVGQSKFSRGCQIRVPELAFEAFQEAMCNLKIEPGEIGASVICSALFDKQRSAEATIVDYLGLTPQPTFLVENACSASTSGVKVAWSLVKSGLHKVVAVIGVEKMSAQSSREANEMMGRLYDITWESPFGLTMASGYALYAQAYMKRYGLNSEHLALIRTKSAFYGTKNPKAVYQKLLTKQEILESEVIASPLRKFDCCANADGASCVIVANKDIAKRACDVPIWVTGIGSASEPAISHRKSFYSISGAKNAGEQAYAMAGIKPTDVDVAEVHDCFTIAEVLAYGDLGFAQAGEGVKELIEQKQNYVGGKIPVNVDGGLLSKGHPIAATGGSQIRTIVQQLRGELKETQVKNAGIGLVHNIGGIGHYCNVIILRN